MRLITLIFTFFSCIYGSHGEPLNKFNEEFEKEIFAAMLAYPLSEEKNFWDKVKWINYQTLYIKDLYNFLKEGEKLSIPSYQVPTKYEKVFDRHTNSLESEYYVGYCRLHNISLSSPWRPAIAWYRFILRIHADNKVTGWNVVRTSGATYNTDSPTPYMTDAFLGEKMTDGKITLQYIAFNEEANEWQNPPVGGYTICKELSWNKSHTILEGKWAGGSTVNPRISPKDQEGNVKIVMNKILFSFSIKDALKDLKRDIEKELSKKLSPDEKWTTTDINSYDNHINNFLAMRKKSNTPLNFNEQKLIIAWYVYRAWNSYINSIKEEKIKKFFEENIDDILGFSVYLKSTWSSQNQKGNAVPMQFGINRLNIATGILNSTFWSQKNTFWGDNNGTSDFPKMHISKMAHEILGHGLFMRYTPGLVDYKKDEYKTLEGNQLAEGLATAVEYTVAKSEGEPDITTSKYKDIKSFVGCQKSSTGRYGAKDKSPNGIYWPGVGSAIKNKYIEEHDGTIQWQNILFFKKIIDGTLEAFKP